MSAPGAPHLVVVPHTHWDREWYRTHEDFRYRLVRLLDGLLDLLESDPDFRHFSLDGQTIVLEDYLEVRPAARERIEKLVRAGRLVIGPWYVLPDEWLVSGEALIRNLRLGLAQAADFGGGMRIGYVPDQFGHVGQLPQLFAGFGFDAAALWRGVGGDVDQTLFHWEAPDGTTLVTAYLIRGYGNAAHLPLGEEALAKRLRGEIDALSAHSRVKSLLLMNGSDHLAPQPGLPAALEAAARAAGASFEIGTLPGFLARAREEAPEALPRHRGELRSGLRSPLLAGCASARLPQKRADFENDRLLTRYLEPLAAWLGALGGDADLAVLALAWRLALQNHPHDSICGCSIDAVHDQMDARFARVAEIGRVHLQHVAGELAQRVVPPPGKGAALAVWNPHATGISVAEGVVPLDATGRSPAVHLRDAAGRRLPVHAEEEEAGRRYADYALPAAGAANLLRGFPPEFFGQHVHEVRLRRSAGRLTADVLMGDGQSPAFDLDSARRGVLEALAREPEAPARFRVRRLPRFRVRFADAFPGCGLRVYRLARGRAGANGLSAERTAKGGVVVENEHLRVEVASDGIVRIVHPASGTTIDDALRLVSEGDRGDEYSFDPVPAGLRVERPERVRVRLAPVSEASVGVRIDGRYRIPAALAEGRRARSSRAVPLDARVILRLFGGVDRVDADVRVDNRARDHRLRIHLRLPFAAERLEVESAFEAALRPIDPAPGAFGSEHPAEFPSGATPQRSFATIAAGARAATVANRGCPEVEAVRESDGSTSLALTLLRAVGWLSRDDLALRPMHAGPPIETPGAQLPGVQRAELSLRLHATGDARRTAEAHSFAAPPLAFGVRGTGEGTLSDGDRLLEIDDPAVVVSALEPAADGGSQARLYNAGAESRRVSVRWNAPGSTLEAVDLLGQPAPDVPLEPGKGGDATLALRGHEIVTLRVRPRRRQATE